MLFQSFGILFQEIVSIFFQYLCLHPCSTSISTNAFRPIRPLSTANSIFAHSSLWSHILWIFLSNSSFYHKNSINFLQFVYFLSPSSLLFLQSYFFKTPAGFLSGSILNTTNTMSDDSSSSAYVYSVPNPLRISIILPMPLIPLLLPLVPMSPSWSLNLTSSSPLSRPLSRTESLLLRPTSQPPLLWLSSRKLRNKFLPLLLPRPQSLRRTKSYFFSLRIPLCIVGSCRANGRK